MRLEPDLLITPTLKLVRPLGAGGMGSVWLARQLALDTDVAVKFISAERESGDAGVALRFEREAQAVAKIQSAHVVRVLDRGVADDGTPYIVMELLEGSTLRQRIRRQQKLGLEEAQSVVEQVAKGISAAHRVGIVHRDIKPSNIFLTRIDDELRVKVLDFGIAKQTGKQLPNSLTRTGALVGSPQYMSPEQLLSAKEVDHHADVWGLAVVAYEMVTGEPPFEGETVTALSMAICNGAHEPPSARDGNLPAELDTFFERAFASEASQRFPSVRALAQHFRAAALGEAPVVEPLPQPHAAADSATAPDAEPWPSTLDETARTDEQSAAPKATFDGAATDAVAPPRGSRRVVAVALVALAAAGLAAWSVRSTPQGASQPVAERASASASAPPAPVSASASTALRVPEGMRLVAGARYWLGCDESNNNGCFADEKPGHEVTLPGFAIDELEVTVAAYDACVRAGRCAPAGRATGCNAGMSGRDAHPINCVSWLDARGYCAWRDKRLPTEAEWEAAARGRDRRSFPWGGDEGGCEHAVWGGSGCGVTSTAPVGNARDDTSPFGVRDMAGNVREWTSTDYFPYPGATTEQAGSGKVNKGSSFLIPLKAVDRMHTRINDKPTERRPELGFRCARTVL